MGNNPEAHDTRGRIQEVALELFTEHGYDNTSLREIAERLGVTKAALYYHFRSKEEIVDSFSTDHIQMVEQLVTWAQSQPPTLATRKELLRRYAERLYQGRFAQVMRFFEHNQARMRDRPAGHRFKERIGTIINVLCPGQPTAVARLRALTAVLTVHASIFVMQDADFSDDERCAAALTVAYELLERNDRTIRRRQPAQRLRPNAEPAPTGG